MLLHSGRSCLNVWYPLPESAKRQWAKDVAVKNASESILHYTANWRDKNERNDYLVSNLDVGLAVAVCSHDVLSCSLLPSSDSTADNQ